MGLLKQYKIFIIVYRTGNKTVKVKISQNSQKNIKKKFASIKKSSTFVLGLSKEVLSPINLLVISFSVINYVVRVRVHAGCVDAHFFLYLYTRKTSTNMLELGIKGRQEEIVTENLTASHIGSGTVRVFATPMMIALMEHTSQVSVKPYLEEGQETVGTRVDVSHISSTPIGLKVWCESEVIEIDRRRIVFKVAAYDEKGLIGEGTHERFVIDVAKFQAKTEEKRK